MKKLTLVRVFEIILGVVIFTLAVLIFRRNEELSFGWILLMALITAATIWVVEGDFGPRSKKIVGLILGFAFCYPIAYLVQLFAAWIYVILKGILWILSIKIVLYAVIIGVICAVVYLIARKYD